MIELTGRKKLLLGCLGLVVLIWMWDLLAGGARPASVQAATSIAPASAAPAEQKSPTPSMSTLMQSEPAVPRRLRVRRDLFVPTSAMRERYDTASGVGGRAGSPGGRIHPTKPPFDQRHQLQGVITGATRLAVIDGQVYAHGAELDGYTLLEVHRARVVFQRGEERAVLLLPERLK